MERGRFRPAVHPPPGARQKAGGGEGGLRTPSGRAHLHLRAPRSPKPACSGDRGPGWNWLLGAHAGAGKKLPCWSHQERCVPVYLAGSWGQARSSAQSCCPSLSMPHCWGEPPLSQTGPRAMGMVRNGAPTRLDCSPKWAGWASLLCLPPS